MKALILAGGFGTRLRPLSCTRPKTLFPILNKPLLQWTYERLAKNNITEIILAVNSQTETAIRRHRIPKNGIHITYSHDPPNKPLGTGGPIKKAEKLIGHHEPFLVLNGDIFADINYTEILKLHEKKKASATIALHEVQDPSRYGVAVLAKNGKIKTFIEKPPPEEAPSSLINAGVYVLNPGIFKYIPKDRPVSFEREIFPKLAKEGTFYGHVFDDLWIDIGKPEEYLEINRILLDQPENRKKNKHRKASTKKPVAFDKNVAIGKGTVIGPYAVLGRDITVGINARIQNSVILPRTRISDFCSVNGAVIGEDVLIGNHVKIGEGCIIGDHARIKDKVELKKHVSICPAKEISESVLKPACIS